MKRLICAASLALAFVVPAAAAQDSNSAKARGGGQQQAAEKSSKPKGKEGTDCDPGRAGVRCNRPKPKKVWFFGKP